MPYAAEISRTNPTCFLFLVDQSGSMNEPMAGGTKPKAQALADAINRLLQNLVLRCAKADGVRDYFHVGLIGYSSKVASAWGGNLAGQTLIPISALANQPLRVEQRTRKVDDGAGGVLDQAFKFPVWYEPQIGGKTFMSQALATARQYLEAFIGRFPACYPPLVLNITDGMPSDGDPRPAARELTALATQDGAALLFNAHLSSQAAPIIEFPAQEQGLPDKCARLLFQMSSPLPPPLLGAAGHDGFKVGPGSRGFVFNADMVSVVRFLDLGTQTAQAGGKA